VDIAPRRDDAYDAMLPIEKLDEALPASDVLVLTVPLTKATERLIDARRLELMKDAAVVVNISRGKVIDETALAEKLRTRRLMGAVLDVFETEPLPASSPLWDLPNAILSPHNSFVGDGNGERLEEIIRLNLREKK
jgi:phosphoglycerate dehydrogenase-like enzyme